MSGDVVLPDDSGAPELSAADRAALHRSIDDLVDDTPARIGEGLLSFLVAAAGLLLVFLHPIAASLVLSARGSGVLDQRGGPTDVVTLLFWLQLVLVPMGLALLAKGAGLRGRDGCALVFLLPIVGFLSLQGQLSMCGIVGELCP